MRSHVFVEEDYDPLSGINCSRLGPISQAVPRAGGLRVLHGAAQQAQCPEHFARVLHRTDRIIRLMQNQERHVNAISMKEWRVAHIATHVVPRVTTHAIGILEHVDRFWPTKPNRLVCCCEVRVMNVVADQLVNDMRPDPSSQTPFNEAMDLKAHFCESPCKV